MRLTLQHPDENPTGTEALKRRHNDRRVVENSTTLAAPPAGVS